MSSGRSEYRLLTRITLGQQLLQPIRKRIDLGARQAELNSPGRQAHGVVGVDVGDWLNVLQHACSVRLELTQHSQTVEILSQHQSQSIDGRTRKRHTNLVEVR